MDLSTKIAGVEFKNPILPGASELVFNGESAARMAETGVGGIVTKTFTSNPDYRVRLRPYQFPLARFNKALERAGSFYSLAAPHVEEMDVVIEKNIPEIAQVCKKKGLPLITSYYESPDNTEDWVKVAKGMASAGATMIELNFSSPTMKGTLEKRPDICLRIIESVTTSTKIPIGVKISPMFEPLVDSVKSWAKKGISFITAHNAPSGIYVDVESELPYGAPAVGGFLIGRPFLPISLGRIVQILKSVDIHVFGVGGIFNGEDALQYLLCGCSLVEIGTAAYVKGLGVFKRVEKEIVSWMKRKNYTSLSDFKGKVLPKIRSTLELKREERAPFSIPPDTPYMPIIDMQKCNLCGNCRRSCFYGVFDLDPEKRTMTIQGDKCWSCGFCVGICPENAIVLVDKETGGKLIWDGHGIAFPFLQDQQ